MVVTLAGMAMADKASQYWNIFLLIAPTLGVPVKLTVVSFLQYIKQFSPKEVTLSVMVMVANSSQLWNRPTPRVVTPLGTVNAARASQPAKAYSPKVSTVGVSANATAVSVVQFSKTLLPIVVTLPGLP